jgi:hypothetical protein
MADSPDRSPRPRSISWSLLASFVALVVLIAGLWFSRARPVVAVTTGPRQLLLAVDGVGWEAFSYAQQRGLFKRFRHSGRMIAPYPSMSHGSWTDIIGTRRAFGDRGRLPTVEARWFDLDAMRIADDPRQVIARQASPYNYMRAFDTYFDPLVEPLMYFPGHRVFDRELEETERAILDGFTGPRYAAYISGTDAMAHTHKDELYPFLVKVDAMIERVISTMESRGGPLEVWMVSDHGNTGGFAEGGAEQYLTPVSMNAAIKRAGLTRRDTGTVLGANDVADVTIALASMVDMYFPDLSKRRRFADEVLREPGVVLTTWMEVAGADKFLVIRDTHDGEAQVRWRHNSDSVAWLYSYQRVKGNPLAMPDSLSGDGTAARWFDDATWRRATIDGPFPDALHRLVAGAEKQIENAPDLIVNLGDGYAHDGDFGRVVRMVRSHGSLSARASFGIVASTTTHVPHDVRAEEVADVMRISPRALLHTAAHLHPSDADSLAAALAGLPARVPSGRADHSVDAEFQRRLKPVVQSMGFFDWTTLRDLQTLLPSSSKNSAGTSGDMDFGAIGKRLEGVDVLKGLSHGVDTLLALTDSLDPAHLDDRLRDAANRVRGIPELRPLATLHDELRQKKDSGNSAMAAGGGATVRSAGMVSWTIPYFLQAALDLPESDSIADPRNRQFALNWRRGAQRALRDHPDRLLGRSVLGAGLFEQVFAERKLWQQVEPSTIPLLYDPSLSDITVVLVPGIYGELFDGELWQRGLHSVRDKLGVRTLSVRADGRCSSAINAGTLRTALRDDTRRRLERGYTKPRYLLIGYSKGGIDATEALLADSVLAHEQVAALVTVATPHLGSPVAERAELPSALLQWASRDTIPTACDKDGAAASLFPATRRGFWADHADRVAERTRLFSIAFAADVHDAHPWMKLTKQVGQFGEPNDGVVAVSASRFPVNVASVDLGTVSADHIAGIRASAFPQEAFLEAVVVTLGELGALDRSTDGAWASARRAWSLSDGARLARASIAPSFAQSLRPRAPLPGGSAGWTPSATFRLLEASSVQDRGIKAMTTSSSPDGYVMRCDQKDLGEFRREYEFVYDAGNGGHEGDLFNGFSIVGDKGAKSGRACHLATVESAIKMTTVSFRFRPVDYPALSMRLRVAQNVTAVDVSNRHRGANDCAFKLWFVVRDTRPGAPNATRLFGYTWTSVDRDGVRSADGALREASSSRRSLVVTTLPEAWLITIGNPAVGSAWQEISRDLVRDLRQAYPGVPSDAFEVVGVTIQSDSDESHSRSEVYLDEVGFRPKSAVTAKP